MAKLSSSAVFTPGLVGSMAKLSSSAFTPGLLGSMAKLSSSAFTPGLLDSMAKLSSSAVFTPAFADLLAQLEAAGIGSDSMAVRLGREEQRLLFGYFVYALVWLLVLQIMVTLFGASDTLGKFADLVAVMTGLSGDKIASVAKGAAYWAYDQLNPPSE
jgi:hypothetical protein